MPTDVFKPAYFYDDILKKIQFRSVALLYSAKGLQPWLKKLPIVGHVIGSNIMLEKGTWSSLMCKA